VTAALPDERAARLVDASVEDDGRRRGGNCRLARTSVRPGRADASSNAAASFEVANGVTHGVVGVAGPGDGQWSARCDGSRRSVTVIP
jgi:hypothetical protein